MTLPDDQASRRALGDHLKSHPGFDSLLGLIDALLSEGGCPWDRSRKLDDCPKYIQGELNEVIEAIGSGNSADIEEELGDLIFMVAFTAKLAEKDARLEMTGLFKRILEKMVYRHPHVFGGEMSADTPDDVVSNWNKLKEREKAGLDGMVDCERPES